MGVILPILLCNIINYIYIRNTSTKCKLIDETRKSTIYVYEDAFLKLFDQ